MSLANALQLSDGREDGVALGQSATDKVALFGATPIVKPTAATQAALALVTLPTAAITTLSIMTQLNALSVLVDAMRTAMVNLGSMAGS